MAVEDRPAAAITVREAVPAEFDAIAALTVQAYRALGDPRFDEYEPEVRAVAARARVCPVLVAVDGGGAVLGSVTYVPGPGTPLSEGERDGEAGFRMLAVDPAAQGRGIGRVLAQACLDRARGEGRDAVHIYVRPLSTAAQRLYAGMGFERTRGRDWEFEPGEWLWSFRYPF